MNPVARALFAGAPPSHKPAAHSAPVAPMTAARLILWWLQHRRPQAQAVDFPLSSSCQGYMPILWQGTLQLHWNYMAPLTASDLELTRMGIQRIVIKHHPTRNGNAYPIANRKKRFLSPNAYLYIQHMNAIYRWWMTSRWELTPIRSEWFCCDVSAPRTSLWAHAVCQISLARKFPVLDTRCISGFRAKRSLPKKEVRKAVTTVL